MKRGSTETRVEREAGRSRLVWLGGVGVGFLLLVAAFASIGGPHDVFAGLGAVLELLLKGGWPAAAYLAGAMGWGRVFAWLFRDARERWAIQCAMGLGLLLTLSHGLGVLGVMWGGGGMWVGVGVVGIGVLLFVHQVAGVALGSASALRARGGEEERGVDDGGLGGVEGGGRASWWLLGLPAAALMLVAACNPPGWLWGSEAGGYDALSYHLQLPEEWLRGGRIRPLEHNVYSYLPGYVEAGFYHIGVVMGAGRDAGGGMAGLVGSGGGRGHGLIACQLLSVGIALLGAWLIARMTRALCERAGLEGGAKAAGAIAGVFYLCTPWTVVVGSLAYNDLAVALFMAAAVVAAVDQGVSPVRRGAICGFLIGAACGCKPTALFMAAPAAGVVMLAMAPRRAWAGMIGAGALAGVLMLLPWLARNWMHGGNPVFPMAAGIFGNAHWTSEQVDRYAAAHIAGGSLMSRVGMLVLRDHGDPSGPVFRGMTHPQWFAFFGIAVASGVAALACARTRVVAAWLCVGLGIQVAAWLLATHLQSRFLIPLAVPACGLFGLAIASRGGGVKAGGSSARDGEGGRRLLKPVLGYAACLAQLAAAAWIFLAQRDGQPMGMLTLGPAFRTGAALKGELAAMSPGERREVMGRVGPEQWVNLAMPAEERVYLLGDATPLYFRPPVLYNTTWDRWTLAELMRESPGEPGRWSERLLEMDVRHVLVNFAELARLRRSGRGWSDPLMTPEAVIEWLKAEGEAVWEWRQTGQVLFRLRRGDEGSKGSPSG